MSTKRCSATTRAGGKCQHPAGFGTEHVGYGTCKWHGGNSPSHKTKAQREMVADAVRTLGLPVNVDPVQAIVAELARGFGAIEWLREQVAAIPADQLHQTWPQAMLRQLNEERDRNARVAAEALRLGLEARAVSVAERYGELLAEVVRVVVTDPVLGLSADQQKHAMRKASLVALGRPEEIEQAGREAAKRHQAAAQAALPSPPPAPEPPTESDEERKQREALAMVAARQEAERRALADAEGDGQPQYDRDGVQVIQLSDFGARRSQRGW